VLNWVMAVSLGAVAGLGQRCGPGSCVLLQPMAALCAPPPFQSLSELRTAETGLKVLNRGRRTRGPLVSRGRSAQTAAISHRMTAMPTHPPGCIEIRPAETPGPVNGKRPPWARGPSTC